MGVLSLKESMKVKNNGGGVKPPYPTSIPEEVDKQQSSSTRYDSGADR